MEESKPQPKIEPAQHTFFFERPDGSLFATHEKDAWNLLRSIKRGSSRCKYIGRSDGVIYRDAVQSISEKFQGKATDEAKQELRDAFNQEAELAKNNRIPPRNMDFMGNPEAVEHLKKVKGL